VARSSFWVTIPLKFEQLVYHSEQPNRKSIVFADLEKDESFTWGKFHRNQSYHSNVMTSSPFYMRANYLSPRDNSEKHSTGSSTWHICLHVYRIGRILWKSFREIFGWRFKSQSTRVSKIFGNGQKQPYLKLCLLKASHEQVIKSILFCLLILMWSRDRQFKFDPPGSNFGSKNFPKFTNFACLLSKQTLANHKSNDVSLLNWPSSL